MNKKSQAAMEFLMTYGWAILVVLAAIGALAYFGVLSPDKFLPEKCMLPSGIACLDFTQNAPDQITIVVRNSAGFDMMNVIARINNSGEMCSSLSVDMPDSNTQNLILDCVNDFKPGKFKSRLYLSFMNKESNLNHTKTGELIIKIG